ncbi:MAG: type II toxin-antitoxin system VapC family toxin [Syntrophobacteraceae bacterium]|nr:type II toxin-antitoxin system VapC family toxin [Syntrophobacteraceae bacterium]
MGRHVVDASVILKWVLGEEREAEWNKALGLLNDWVGGRVELMAPDLWVYEVGNFLGRRLPEQALEKMELLFNLKFSSIALTENMLRLCFHWMAENGVTFYDASYLAVAEETKSILVTADAKFAEKMSRPQFICLLRDL